MQIVLAFLCSFCLFFPFLQLHSPLCAFKKMKKHPKKDL